MTENKELYIVFSRTGTMPSNIIALFTQKEYSHVSLSLDRSLTNMYSFGRLTPAKALPGGFVKENIYDGVFAMFPKSKCLVYKLNITDKQYENFITELNKFIKNNEKYKYNVKGLLFAYLNKPYKRDYYYFCSQFVSEILINSGIYKTDKQPELIKPMDLLEIENKVLVYEGYANEEKFLESNNNLFIYNWLNKQRLRFKL